MSAEINHAGRTHAVLSASAAARWLACTPSARAEMLFEDSSSEYAKEGTAFHELCEALVRMDEKAIAKARASQYFSAEMDDAAMAATDYVNAMLHEATQDDETAQLMLEQRLDLSRWVPHSFGTADVVIISDGKMTVGDYKYGKGVRVEARENPQMKLYALGAYARYDYLFSIREVRMVIMQPRLDNWSECKVSVNDLLAWGKSIQDKALTAYMGGGQFAAGDHCRFCRAKGRCRAYADMCTETAFGPEAKPDMIATDELGGYLDKADAVSSWASTIKEEALRRALAGDRIAGYKIVEGRSVRTITDREAAARALTEAEVPESLIWRPRELATLTDLEKLVGKKRLPEILGNLIVKPKGKPALVSESDRRPEFNLKDADDMFAGINA